MLRLKHDNQKVLSDEENHFKKNILNFKRKLHIITITQQDETFTEEICSMQTLIKVKKLANVVYDESLNNKLIRFKMCVTTKRDTKSESNYMLIDVVINEKRLRIRMNLNVSKNFLATRYANYHKLFIQRKNVVYRLLKANHTALNNE